MKTFIAILVLASLAGTADAQFKWAITHSAAMQAKPSVGKPCGKKGCKCGCRDGKPCTCAKRAADVAARHEQLLAGGWEYNEQDGYYYKYPPKQAVVVPQAFPQQFYAPQAFPVPQRAFAPSFGGFSGGMSFGGGGRAAGGGGC